MKTILILFALWQVIVVEGSSPSARLMGGIEAEQAQYPYMVSLRTPGNVHFCGGFIYNDRWVVTTATCVRNRTDEQFTMHMGTNSRTDFGERHDKNDMIIHPNYDVFTIKNNIAMVQSVKVIQLQPTGPVNSIPIGGGARTGGGVLATISGWGMTSHLGAFLDNLMGLQVTTLTNEQCLAQHSNLNRRYIYENTLCTTSPKGEGICTGDGGGPLVTGEAPTRQVIGIASWNMPCGTGTPDVYVRLLDYVSWITETGSRN